MQVLLLNSEGTATNGGKQSKGRLIAAGPLTTQPCSMPFRFVIVQRESGHYCVGREEMLPPNAIELILARGTKVFDEPMSSCLTETTLFPPEQLAAAVRFFSDRLRNSAACLEHPIEVPQAA